MDEQKVNFPIKATCPVASLGKGCDGKEDQSGVRGIVEFVQKDEDTCVISYHITGLTKGKHGFHIHEFADFSNGCTSAGGHYNPFSKLHGGPKDVERHAGDLGNIVADENGRAVGEISDNLVKLFGPTTIVGRSVMIHADEDDLGAGGHEDSHTTGHAGARVACGEVQVIDSYNDCVQILRTTRTVHVPCIINVCKEYIVKVPRQVTEEVPRTVQYTEYESVERSVPYTVNRYERRTRMEIEKYQVPVTTTHTRMVTVTKKVPKTVYVDATSYVSQGYKTTTMETMERDVQVPYIVDVPETKYRTVTEQVPIQRSHIEMDTVTKTVFEPQVRTRCIPETTMVSKRIPVYDVISKSCSPCAGNPAYGIKDMMPDLSNARDGRVAYNEALNDVQHSPAEHYTGQRPL